MVEVRGDPHGVFRPREGGLTRIRCFRVVSCCRVVSSSSGRTARGGRLGPGGSGQGARARGLGPEIQKIGKNRQKSKMSRMIQNDLK